MIILTIIGARPQFIKAAPVSRELRKYHKEILVHTGQHYDENMSDIFFRELNIPHPDYNLEVGSGNHGRQTGQMLAKIEDVIFDERPDAMLVYGDTNSTLAGALAASKLHIPVVHIEAGLRSFNMKMPEEQNRILTDHISSLLFCPTKTAVKNLKREGITDGVYNVGDVMLDAVLHNVNFAEMKYSDSSITGVLKEVPELGYKTGIELRKNGYYLSTIHRAENTDDYRRLRTILDSFELLDLPVLMPIHPRTKKVISENIRKRTQNVTFVEPVGYLEMLYLTANAKKVVTDSGGLQKEAYFLETPCVTLRDQTEWVETLEGNWNVLCKIDINDICENIKNVDVTYNSSHNYFGDGKASIKIVDILGSFFKLTKMNSQAG